MKHKGNTCPLPLCAVAINKLNCATIVPPLLSDKAKPKRETGEVLSVWAVYNHWTGLVDWTGGLALKIIFMPRMKLTRL